LGCRYGATEPGGALRGPLLAERQGENRCMLNTTLESRASGASPDLSAFLSRLLLCCLDIQTVWSLGHDGLAEVAPDQSHSLLVFADRHALQTLQKADRLHRADVQVLVVLDGDEFESVWGPRRLKGSLARWAWRQVAQDVAYYDESRWAEPPQGNAAVTRVRRKAFLIWPAPLPRR
jgi:hypothetical protein